MSNERLTKVSKYLSKHLRHQPERLGLSLEKGGWVGVEALLSACAQNNFPIRPEELRQVVETSDKQRFAFDESGTKIRANQGHSTEVDLELTPQIPPERLYHGTGHRSVEAILASGLLKMARHHVHLSAELETAKKVGGRHGRPVVFEIDCAAMLAAGFSFYCSQNGVWLVERVPPEFLKPLSQ